MNTMDEAIKEVALRHGVLIKPEDPALIMATINEKLLAHYGQRWISDMMNEMKAVSILIERNNAQARQASSQTITQAGRHVYQQVINATSQAGELAGKDVKAEGLALQRDLEQFRAKFVGQVYAIQWFTFFASVMTALALGVFIGMNI